MTEAGNRGEGNRASRRRFLQGIVAGGIGLIAQVAAAGDAGTPGETTPVGPPVPPVAPPASGRTSGFPVPRVGPRAEARVHLNQVGYAPNEPKRAVVPTTGAIEGNGFVVVDDDVVPTVRFRGTLTEYAGPAQEGTPPHHFFADFDAFSRPGRYRLRLSDGHLSPPFSIGAAIYEQIVPLIFRYFDVQRCGPQHSEDRDSCHLDDGVIDGGPRDGQPIDAAGGWHDAGDYLKFVETTSYVTAVMLFAYDRARREYDRALAREPRTGGLPMPLAYARIGLEWLLKMHPRPDEFYYQVGDETDHDTWRLPEQDTLTANAGWKPRTVFYGVGANLAGRTAAAFALAARLYKLHDAQFAARCLAAAQSVYRLGLKNPSVVTTKPFDFYPETTWQDDMEWGAAALYQATRQPDYLRQATDFARRAGPAGTYTSVYCVHTLAHATLYPEVPPAVQAQLLGYLRADAEDVRRCAQSNPYGLGTPYVWGTAEAAAGAALTSLVYAELSGDREYAGIGYRQRDFLLGCNPFNLSCLVGAGTRFPLFPHHQVADLKGIELTGAIVGGPTDLKTFEGEHMGLTDAEFDTLSPSPPPPAAGDAATVSVYQDVVQDYVTNEPANDYTVKFFLLLAYYLGPD